MFVSPPPHRMGGETPKRVEETKQLLLKNDGSISVFRELNYRDCMAEMLFETNLIKEHSECVDTGNKKGKNLDAKMFFFSFCILARV